MNHKIIEAAKSIPGITFRELESNKDAFVFTKTLDSNEIKILQKMDRYRYDASGNRNCYSKNSFIQLIIHVDGSKDHENRIAKLNWYANSSRYSRTVSLAFSESYLSIMKIIDDIKLIN